MSQAWNPAQYNAFAGEREQPFWDLAGLIEPSVSPALVDLGCGDGRLTAALHGRLQARVTAGIDSSQAMLTEAAAHAGETIGFSVGDIAQWMGSGQDVVFSNAALQWVGDHPAVLRRWRDALSANGQLAVQIPANADHASHVVSRELGHEWLGDGVPPDPVAHNVLSPEVYARLLAELGFERQHVRLQVYAHTLSSSGDVVEWVKGTSLTRFKAVLGADDYERFVEEYRHRLLAELGDYAPYLYTFKRILMWGRLG
jgi:trans-aconitate 2-methyltransferase